MRAHAAVQFLTCLFATATNQVDRLLIGVDCEMNHLYKKEFRSGALVGKMLDLGLLKISCFFSFQVPVGTIYQEMHLIPEFI